MMFRLLKRRRAIKKFVCQLPLELHRRFGAKRFYSLKEIDRAIEHGDLDRAFIAFAHALFSSREEFDSYYGQLKLGCTYDGLRKHVSKRFFCGTLDFDASSILQFAKRSDGDEFYESHLAE